MAGVRLTCGADAKAVAKVTVPSIPLEAQPDPVVTVMTPEVSFPLMLTVGVVQAAEPAAIPGVEPPVTMCPFTVKSAVTTSAETVIFMFVESAVSKGVPVEFWIWKAEVELTRFLNAVAPVLVILKSLL